MPGAFSLLLFPEIWDYFQENAENVCIGNVYFYDLRNTKDNFSLHLKNRLTPTRIDISTRYCVSYIYLVNNEVYNWSYLIVFSYDQLFLCPQLVSHREQCLRKTNHGKVL
jgi:hypothetical protein